MAWYDPRDWDEEYGDLGRAAAVVATGGGSELYGATPVIEEATGEKVDLEDLTTLGGGALDMGDAFKWLASQGEAAFPGAVDAVDTNVDYSTTNALMGDLMGVTPGYADAALDLASIGSGNAMVAADAGYDAGATAMDTAMNVGQSAYDTGQQFGTGLENLGLSTYGQAMGDQAQMEALGQYLGLYGEQLGNFIAGQGNALGLEQQNTGVLLENAFANLGNQALAAGQAQNPTLAALAGQSGAGGQAYAGNLGALGTSLQGLGSDLYGRSAPVFDPNQQTAALQQADQYARALAGLEATPGPSAAQAQLNLATNQAMQNNLALARSGSGFGESAQAMSQAIAANALAGQDAANQSAMLRAQEDAAWRQRQASNLTGAGQLGLGGAQQFGQQTEFGATLEQTQNAQNADAYLQALAQSGQLTAQAAQTYLQGLQQSGQLTQQQADNALASYGLGSTIFGQGADALQSGVNANAATQLEAMGLGLGATQQGQQMGLDAILAGIQAGQSGAQLAGDLYARGADTMFQGNELGLGAIDAYLGGAGLQQTGFQTSNDLLNTALGAVGQANDIYSGNIQAAMDAYNQAVANAQNWQELGISQEQAETDRQQNYMELMGALAQAVGDAIPG